MPIAGSAEPQARARIARASRQYGRNSPEVAQARRDHAAEKIAAYVARVVADAPPLTTDQRDRIARLLTPAGGGVV